MGFFWSFWLCYPNSLSLTYSATAFAFHSFCPSSPSSRHRRPSSLATTVAFTFSSPLNSSAVTVALFSLLNRSQPLGVRALRTTPILVQGLALLVALGLLARLLHFLLWLFWFNISRKPLHKLLKLCNTLVQLLDLNSRHGSLVCLLLCLVRERNTIYPETPFQFFL